MPNRLCKGGAVVELRDLPNALHRPVRIEPPFFFFLSKFSERLTGFCCFPLNRTLTAGKSDGGIRCLEPSDHGLRPLSVSNCVYLIGRAKPSSCK
jgi:hypothetical protein